MTMYDLIVKVVRKHHPTHFTHQTCPMVDEGKRPPKLMLHTFRLHDDGDYTIQYYCPVCGEIISVDYDDTTIIHE